MNWTKEQVRAVGRRLNWTEAQVRAAERRYVTGPEAPERRNVTGLETPERSKYGARKKEVNGILFDSKKEALRYQHLVIEERALLIRGLERQRRWLLQAAFTDATGKKHRAIEYISDFDYFRAGRPVVEDVKGYRTPAYRLKAKLFRAKYPDVEFIET